MNTEFKNLAKLIKISVEQEIQKEIFKTENKVPKINISIL